jgi:hypothetical protein
MSLARSFENIDSMAGPFVLDLVSGYAVVC